MRLGRQSGWLVLFLAASAAAAASGAQQVVDRMFERIGVPESEATRIASGNASRLYDLATP